MADAGESSINVFFITVVIALLGFVGVGLWYAFGTHEGRDTPAEGPSERKERAEMRGLENAQARDSLARKLVLTRYDLEEDAVTGTVVNNTDRSFVNVQVRFRLFDAQDSAVGSVHDLAPIIKAGDLWNFRVALPSGPSVARAEPQPLEGQAKEPLDPNAR